MTYPQGSSTAPTAGPTRHGKHCQLRFFDLRSVGGHLSSPAVTGALRAAARAQAVAFVAEARAIGRMYETAEPEHVAFVHGEVACVLHVSPVTGQQRRHGPGAVEQHLAGTELTRLDDPLLWGGPVDDERHLLVGRSSSGAS